MPGIEPGLCPRQGHVLAAIRHELTLLYKKRLLNVLLVLKHNYPYKESKKMKRMKVFGILIASILLLSLVSASHDYYTSSASESQVIKKSSSWSSGSGNNKQDYRFSSTESIAKKQTTTKGKTTQTNKRTFTFTETSTNTQTVPRYGSACQGPYHSARFPRDDPDREHYYNDYYYKPCQQHDGSYSWRY